MLKKSLKYLTVVFVNFLILTFLLSIWTDDFELEYNHLVRPIEFLKIIGISILGLILLRVTTKIIHRKFDINSSRAKIKVSILLILFISSCFYVYYGIKIYKNRYLNKELRYGIMEKVEPVPYGLAYGSQAGNLTRREYLEISRLNWFPNLPKEADSISYSYDYDGFLPDYNFSLSYDLPKEIEVDTMTYKNRQFSKGRNFEIIDNKKRVHYYEWEW